MRWHSALSEASDTEAAIIEAASAINRALGPGAADLAIVHLTPHYANGWAKVPELVRRELPGALLVGASGAGIVGEGHEVEHRRGLAIMAASLPDVKLHAFHIDAGALPEDHESAGRWREIVALEGDDAPRFLLVPDPFTCDIERLLVGLDLAWPGTTKVGGAASGGTMPGANVLFCGDRTYHVGVVGLAMSGAIALDAVVAQACRPIGEPMLITRCRGSVVHELNSEAPVAVLRELYASLDSRDRRLFRNSLFVGIEIDGAREQYGPGDFLVRNITGMDAEDGAISVAARPAQWQVLQFHLRDARTAATELTAALRRYDAGSTPVAGALMFNCVGRGLQLFGRPDHDTDIVQEYLPDVPLGGALCNGEIGPQDGRTLMHGYTSVFALFREPAAAD